MSMEKHIQNGWNQQGRSCSALEDFCSTSIVVEYKSTWHFSRKDLEDMSPSKIDGIDWRRESEIRVSYCSFLQNLGMELRVPQLTIATAIMFCHRFYLHQSHAKNNWQTMATVCMFLASKVEETPCSVAKVIDASWKVLHRNDITSTQRIHLKEKELIFIGERLLLSTIGFDFNVQHPYKPLVTAIKKFKLQQDVTKIAWNFVNDWLRTTLCLQYKPHYIAAGSLYLAARLKNVELPSIMGSVWWQEFDVMPQQLQDVIRQMMQQIGFKRTGNASSAIENTTKASLPAPAAGMVDLDCLKASKTNTLLPAKEVASNSPDSVLTQACSNIPSPSSKEILKDGPKTAFPRHTTSSIAACNNIKYTKLYPQPGEFKRTDRAMHYGGRVRSREGNARTATRISTSNKVASISVGSDKEEMERTRSKLKRRCENETQKLVGARESGIQHETAFNRTSKLARVSYH